MFELGTVGGIVRCDGLLIGDAEAFSLCDRYSRRFGLLFGIISQGFKAREGVAECGGPGIGCRIPDILLLPDQASSGSGLAGSSGA